MVVEEEGRLRRDPHRAKAALLARGDGGRWCAAVDWPVTPTGGGEPSMWRARGGMEEGGHARELLGGQGTMTWGS
ncbi:hypothetical protein E2562_010381 [Oryza meyeriana var. granulata]|uniref:Uncharacterized protein n=1 Tax=Oryza meyeriana var. granulata TaxID=110450 RepID=A0A6G1F6L9_9ORYZ|nr:hypothetical protein E2562_010381 [Oryza meyeriana var. granulata]